MNTRIFGQYLKMIREEVEYIKNIPKNSDCRKMGMAVILHPELKVLENIFYKVLVYEQNTVKSKLIFS